METYLVGGAVRDALLKREVLEKDWVVVGAEQKQLLALGYKQVGKDFPVFLHPKTKDEYALARLERKSGVGYHGFECISTPSVTLEQDLLRRDLTINAMAEDQYGNLIDPYGGQGDLNNRLLRHVSDAFREDPVRILRIARFAARYAYLGFRVADETNALMIQMVMQGEAASLVAERVWQEMFKALQEPRPDVFFSVLRQCGALRVILPELDALYGVPASKRWHGEVDTGVHTMMVLRCAVSLSEQPVVRFAALVHDLGKALTPMAKWPSHHGHDVAGVKPVRRLCQRLRVPKAYVELAVLVAKYHIRVHSIFEQKAGTIVTLLQSLDPYRKQERFLQFLLCCQADAKGRIAAVTDYPQADFLRQAASCCCAVSAQSVIKQGVSGAAISQALFQQREKSIQQLIEQRG